MIYNKNLCQAHYFHCLSVMSLVETSRNIHVCPFYKNNCTSCKSRKYWLGKSALEMP